MTVAAVISFNCAKKLQDVEQVSAVLKSVLASATDPPEYIAFCLQEVAPIHDSCLGWTEPYLAPFIASVPEEFDSLSDSVSGGTAVIVFIRNGVPSPFRVETDQSAFGMLWSSLKGAALVSLHFDDHYKQSTFVSAHFAAGESRKDHRNRDFRLLFEAFDSAERPGQLILGGDSNYRTSDGTFRTDELTQELNAGAVGAGLTEAQIDFEPTYKFELGTARSVSKRVPSYCDRILFRKLTGSRTSMQKYGVTEESLYSDHRPVFAISSTPIEAEPPYPSLPQPHGSGAAKGNRSLSSNLVDLIIGSGAFTIGTSTGRISLAVAIGFFTIYMLIRS